MEELENLSYQRMHLHPNNNSIEADSQYNSPFIFCKSCSLNSENVHSNFGIWEDATAEGLGKRVGVGPPAEVRFIYVSCIHVCLQYITLYTSYVIYMYMWLPSTHLLSTVKHYARGIMRGLCAGIMHGLCAGLSSQYAEYAW